MIRLLHTPAVAPPSIVAGYLSHLHIDLMQRARGQGVGRLLIERQVSQLRSLGSSAVHLEVAAENTNAQEFYRHLGFIDLERTPDSLFMGIRL